MGQVCNVAKKYLKHNRDSWLVKKGCFAFASDLPDETIAGVISQSRYAAPSTKSIGPSYHQEAK